MCRITLRVTLNITDPVTTAAFLVDGLINERDRRLMIDHNKVKLSQEKVTKTNEKFQVRCQTDNINVSSIDEGRGFT